MRAPPLCPPTPTQPSRLLLSWGERRWLELRKLRRRQRARLNRGRGKRKKVKPLRLPSVTGDDKRPPLSPEEAQAATPQFQQALVHFNIKTNHCAAAEQVLLLDNRTIPYKNNSNFYGVYDERSGYTYSFFPSTGHISAYRIESLEAVKECVPQRQFSTLFNNFCGGWEKLVRDERTQPRVVNICCSGEFSKRSIDVREIYRRATASGSKHQFLLTLNLDKCPFLKCVSKSGREGSIQLFATGTYTCLGSKTWTRVEELYRELCVFITEV